MCQESWIADAPTRGAGVGVDCTPHTNPACGPSVTSGPPPQPVWPVRRTRELNGGSVSGSELRQNGRTVTDSFAVAGDSADGGLGGCGLGGLGGEAGASDGRGGVGLGGAGLGGAGLGGEGLGGAGVGGAGVGGAGAGLNCAELFELPQTSSRTSVTSGPISAARALRQRTMGESEKRWWLGSTKQIHSLRKQECSSSRAIHARRRGAATAEQRSGSCTGGCAAAPCRSASAECAEGADVGCNAPMVGPRPTERLRETAPLCSRDACSRRLAQAVRVVRPASALDSPPRVAAANGRPGFEIPSNPRRV